ncbi:cupin [Helicobacter himalayensis]|uniref:cupin n=1 Tax=Helicobacter himalayensis TaxID=1591088 RepID=UPI000830B39C|nr:cupin [Helicobacter himalayensis]
MEIVRWSEGAFEKDGVKVQVLVQNSNAKEIQILLAKNGVMKEHKAPFDISVQVLCGNIWFEVGGERVEMGALDMVCLKASVPHSLGGIEDSIVRLSLAQRDSLARVSAVLKN